MTKQPFLARALINVGWRYLLRHVWQTALMVLGITLGVAVVVGIDMANESASRAFDLSTESIAVRATHYLSIGGQPIPDDVYVDLRRAGLEVPAAPIVSDYALAPNLDNLTLQLLGVDPFAEAPFRSYLGSQSDAPIGALTDFFTQPNSVLISENLAQRFDLALGDKIELEYAGEVKAVTIAGLLRPSDSLSRRALDGILLADIATAQELTGRLGTLDRVDLILPDDPAVKTALEAALPNGAQILPVAARSGTIEQMTAAFRLNLTALSLLALVVALFLIYNTMTFSVVQRRPLFGTLRSLGVTSGEVFRMVIAEAFIIGVLGAGFGILLGILMGRGAVGLVSQTINDLFFVTTVQDIPIPLNSLFKGGIMGILATVLTAAFPAWEAASVPPRTALSRANLESKAQKIVRWLGLAGALVIVAGGAILFIPTKNLIISFAGTFAVVFGFAMLTPITTIWLMALSSRITSRFFGVLGRMAPREVVNSISRTSVAVAALMVSISVTIGVSLMVGSFRFTVETWMTQILQGDVYISVPGSTLSQPLQAIRPEALALIESTEGVVRADFLQSTFADSPQGPIVISANNNPNDGMEQLYLATDYPPEVIWDEMAQGAIIISEPLYNRLGLPLHGGEITLYTPEGEQVFPVAGIYYDYASTQGNVIMSLDVYRSIWDDDEVDAVALTLADGVDEDLFVRELQERLAPAQSLLIRPNQSLRAETLDIFDRTFAITGALQLMTTFVAFVGVLSAMMSLQLDKQRQLAILKAIGMTARQLWGLITLETGLMGAVAGILAMPTGYILSLILVYIINRRSFGWTLQMQIIPEPFVQALVISVVAAVLAGLYPAKRIIDRNTADAMRFD